MPRYLCNRILVWILPLLLVLTSCLQKESHNSHVIQIQLGEFYLNPNEIRVVAGQKVRLEINNEGQIRHELMIGHGLELDSGKPEKYEHDLFAGVTLLFEGDKASLEREGHHGTMILLEPGGRGSLTFTAPPGRLGEWEMACFQPNHYESGMKGKFTVKLK